MVPFTMAVNMQREAGLEGEFIGLIIDMLRMSMRG